MSRPFSAREPSCPTKSPISEPDVAPPIRPAEERDNPVLIDLERSSPQGTRLVIHSEREDYFIRSRIYGNHTTLVAVDRDVPFGVMAGTLKRLHVAGKLMTGACFYDLRLHPDYRRTVLGRHMLGVWNRMERWAIDAGANFIYGFVKGDNSTMLGFHGRKEYATLGKMLVVSRPVFKRRRVDIPVTEYFPEDGDGISRALTAEYREKNLFPADFDCRYLTPEMRETGLFSCLRAEKGESYASVGLYRIAEIVRMRVLKIPPVYKALGAFLSPVERLIPVPRVPREGGAISYYHLFAHVASGPDGMELWRKLVNHANNLALDGGVMLLTGAFDSADPFLPRFRKGSLNTIEYHLGVRRLGPGIPGDLEPFFVDVRDMD